jgi:hypothetical protein
MTRKDFELIAGTLKAQWQFARTDEAKALLTATVQLMARNLATTNKQFNHDKFVRACGAVITATARAA